MLPRSDRRPALLIALVVLTLAVGSAPAAVADSLQLTGRPTQIRVPSLLPTLATPKLVARAKTMLRLSWPQLIHAAQYEVTWRRATAKSVTVRQTSRTQFDLSGLAPGTAYIVRVRALAADRTPISAWSPGRTATTATSGFPRLAPDGLTVEPGQTQLKAVWRPLTKTDRFRLKIVDTSALTATTWHTVSAAQLSVSDLLRGTSYAVSVRHISQTGRALSAYSSPVKATTLTQSAPLRVGSFNVRCSRCYEQLPGELPWSERRDAVAATILETNLDVLGVQEASQGWLLTPAGKKINRSQFEDLVSALGSRYALTNRHRNNCVDSVRTTRCKYRDRGASKGTKIIYNTRTLRLLKSGSKGLTRIDDALQRFVAWAVFKQLSSGKQFFFANVHLDPRRDTPATGKTYFELRRQQAKDAIAAIRAANTSGLPVILVGDLNSHKFRTPTNAPYDVVVSSGLIDPLGNPLGSKRAIRSTIEKRIRTQYNSYSGWQRTPPKSKFVNGTYIDYIFVSPMRVSEWETVMHLDAGGQLKGIVPSDHHLIRATVWLP